jgi:phage tail-like protein
MPVHRDDPYININFVVQIEAVPVAGFSEVILPPAWADVIEYREGGEPNTVRKLPGRIHFGNLVLVRGVTGSTDLYDWWRAVVEGHVVRRSVTVVLLDEAHDPVMRWIFRRAWPVRYQPSALNARGRETVIETLEIAHEGMEVE